MVSRPRYRLYIKKAESFYGVTRTREIHEAAIKALSDKDAQTMALDYASLERKLGEVRHKRAPSAASRGRFFPFFVFVSLWW